MHMAKEVLPNMIKDLQPVLKMSRSEAAEQLEKLWAAQEGFGDAWEDAKLRDVARYLIGAKGLQIPERFAWLVPTHL